MVQLNLPNLDPENIEAPNENLPNFDEGNVDIPNENERNLNQRNVLPEWEQENLQGFIPVEWGVPNTEQQLEAMTHLASINSPLAELRSKFSVDEVEAILFARDFVNNLERRLPQVLQNIENLENTENLQNAVNSLDSVQDDRIPDIIKGTIPLQNENAERLLNRFKRNGVWRQPYYKSLLVLGCRNGDFLMNQLIPLLPDNITDIFATDLALVDEARLKHADHDVHKERNITFIKMDVLDPKFKKERLYDCIISLWDMRWYVEGFPSSYCVALMELLEPRGTLAVLYESYHHCFFAVQNVGRKMEKWKPFVEPILEGLPMFYTTVDEIRAEGRNAEFRRAREIIVRGPLRIPVEVRGISLVDALRIRRAFTAIYRTRRSEFMHIRSSAALREFMEEAFRFSAKIPHDRLDEFYTDVFNDMIFRTYRIPGSLSSGRAIETPRYMYSFDTNLIGYTLPI